ncbi:hypothetical protein EVAR_43604_1 [Eumeta japonica]|uniref:Uncharacterized protein n=1 Tax=Eumeta variegata TaxID=151549 RepID=A0A4C1XCU5_EUMVA|nr:hypothetical protein EVAR_43604_1 [Eumeta japonica]
MTFSYLGFGILVQKYSDGRCTHDNGDQGQWERPRGHGGNHKHRHPTRETAPAELGPLISAPPRARAPRRIRDDSAGADATAHALAASRALRY